MNTLDSSGQDPRSHATAEDMATLGRSLSAQIAGLGQKLDATAQKLDDRINATNKDLVGLGQNLSAQIANLGQKLDATAQRLDDRIDSVDSTTKRIAVAVVDIQADIRDLKADKVARAEFRQGLATMTAIASRFDQEHRATLIHGEALTEIQVQLKDHERRITGLESSSGR